MRLFFTRCVKFRNLPLAYQAVLNPGYVRRPSGEENPASGGGIRFGVNFRLMRCLRYALAPSVSSIFSEPSARMMETLRSPFAPNASAAGRENGHPRGCLVAGRAALAFA